MTKGFWWTEITFGSFGLASGGQSVYIEMFSMFAIGSGLPTGRFY